MPKSFRIAVVALAFSLSLFWGRARGQYVIPPGEPASQIERDVESDEEDEIETDRDSFTPATTTSPARRWILESAWSFIDNRRVPDTHSLPEFLSRYGINDWLELRIGWNYEVGGAPNSISDASGILKIPVGEQWNAHAEYFGVFSQGRERDGVQHYFSPGVHYLVTQDYEIGLRVGWGLNEQAATFFPMSASAGDIRRSATSIAICPGSALLVIPPIVAVFRQAWRVSHAYRCAQCRKSVFACEGIEWTKRG